MRHACVVAVAAVLAAVTYASPAATDVCDARFCTKDNDATCDRKFEKCPVCMSYAVGGRVVRCTSPTLGFCSVLGIGDQKCDKPWTDPDDPENPTTTPAATTETPTTTAKNSKTPAATTVAPTTTSKVTTLTPTTTKAGASTKPVPSTTPVATAALEVPTTQPVTTSAKTDDSGTSTGWIMYAGIGVGAAVVIGVVALLVLRMTRRNEEDDDDEESSYKQPTTTAQSTQYNPYSNNPPPATAEASAAVAAANLRAKLNQSPADNSSATVAGAAVVGGAVASAAVVEGTRQKSVHTDVWGNVPSSFREGDVASYSGNDSFLSDGSLRRTGNSANGDAKPRDNETRLSVEF